MCPRPHCPPTELLDTVEYIDRKFLISHLFKYKKITSKKNSDILHISAQNIDCGAEIRKIMYTHIKR